ncbi:MAG TPA: prolyl oligopeptidase family serine peptidase [Tepidisphaeraceae bacterium]|nr:prolyl oligopeptidase family serine peptidase [Tepidisphaeraceae bacterium]
MTYRAMLVVAAILFPSLARAADPWETIKPYMAPPAEFAGKLGEYRSPLKFENGREVKSPEQWAERRKEILAKWTGVMGAWPAAVAEPRITVVESVEREGFTQHKVRVTVAKDRVQRGYLLVPPGATKEKPAPAVLVPFYEPETSINVPNERTKDLNALTFRAYAYHLAKRGFVTLAIGSPGGDARQPDTAGNATLQPLSYLAYVAHNCAGALAARPEVDAKRIGIVGHSYGGKWALFASALSDRFAAAVWSDPGIVFDEKRGNVNYWEPWYLGLDPALKEQRKRGVITADAPRTGPYKAMVEKGMDLHELHALLAPRPFFVSGGAEDPPARWIPLNHSVAVNKVLGVEGRVGMQNRPAHGPNAEANEVVYAFFEHFLKP